MSEKYDEYLRQHVNAVREAGEWMLANLRTVDGLSHFQKSTLKGNLLIHDDSKLSGYEYDAYDAYFYGEKDLNAFNHAWLHHIHNNKHHWQHWILVNGYGKFSEPGVVTALEMPKEYVLEMIADWWSFSWRSGNLREVFGWYEDHKGKIVLHPRTRELVESVLGEIRVALDEEDSCKSSS